MNRAFDHKKCQNWISPKDVIPYEKNAKKHDKTQVDNVANSIKRFGWQQDVVITQDKVLVIGHCRRLAALKLGCEMPYHMIDKSADELTDNDIKELRIADNLTNESPWDFELGAEDIEGLEFAGFDFDLSQFEFEEEKEVEEDDFDVVLPEEPKSKLGDIYKLGNHRLICGDSTDSATIEKLMDGQLADLLITDPPYNVNYEGKTKDALTIQNDNMGDMEFREFLADAFGAADSVMRKGAVFYIWHADSEGYNFRGACVDTGWKVRETLIWNKNSMVMGRQDYQWKHEPCLYGWKEGASHLWASDRKQTTILSFDRPSKSLLHPTMKPIALFAYQIGNNTHEGDAVLDLFGGSGTSIMACEQLNRKCYMCELDPKYVDVIIDRWEQYTGRKAEKVNV